ncbi:DUF202 domain-containing protein [Mycobacterium sp. NPDC003449]
MHATARDAGLATERTLLSWRRTVITLVGASIATFRTLSGLHCSSGVLIGIVGLTGAAAAAMVSSARHRSAQPSLRRCGRVHRTSRLAGAGVLASVAAGTLLLATTAAVAVACG